MKNNKFLIAIISLLVMILQASCSDNSENRANYQNNDELKLTPDEWLRQYNAAWKTCNQEIPLVQFHGTNFLNPEEDINESSRLEVERTNRVESLVKLRFPKLCEYLKIPEYQALLVAQGRQFYNDIMQQGQNEIDQMEEENRQQVLKNQHDLELQKQLDEQYLKDHPAPQYTP
ncbi:hypothetical protein HXX01_00545 [Candidatus Nomurabacteria bacterium]|nr:hypothetical protein [Candidatus Nomurabacteria bacterium]